MQGMHPNIICHKLVVCPKPNEYHRRKRELGEEQHKAIKEEVDKLLNENFTKEVM